MRSTWRFRPGWRTFADQLPEDAMRALLAALAVIAAFPAPAWSSPAAWVRVTRPMLSCGNGSEDAEQASERLLRALPRWRAGRTVPAGCAVLRPGVRLILASVQPAGNVVVLYEYCTPHCSPFMWPVATPSREVVGPYLEPATAPPGARHLEDPD